MKYIILNCPEQHGYKIFDSTIVPEIVGMLCPAIGLISYERMEEIIKQEIEAQSVSAIAKMPTY